MNIAYIIIGLYGFSQHAMVAQNARLSCLYAHDAGHMRFCKITTPLIRDMTCCIHFHLNIIVKLYVDIVYSILHLLLSDCMASLKMLSWHIARFHCRFAVHMQFCKISAFLIRDMTFCIHIHLNIIKCSTSIKYIEYCFYYYWIVWLL